MPNLTISLLLVFAILFPPPSRATATSGTADWTIMIFMNADNDLEQAALINFAQLAEVGSNDKINALVQFDRIGKYAHTTPDWSQTLRFRVTKGMAPLPKFALQDLGEVNMGDGRVLEDFVAWSRHQFPAKHYMLVIWDHGQGWRLLLDEFNGAAPQPMRSQVPPVTTTPGNVPAQASTTIRGPGYRSISYDETNGKDRLYNSEIHDSLVSVLKGQKLDVIGFDACVMAMVETAYAFQDVAHYMVGSEELEPGMGWDYKDWFERINKSSPTGGAALSQLTVASYKAQYEHTDPDTTLSAIDLSRIEPLTSSLDKFSKISKAELLKELGTFVASRRVIPRYGITPSHDYWLFHIDLGKFLEEIRDRTKNPQLRNASNETRTLINGAVIANYFGANRGGSFGSTGLAIYFPSTLSEYDTDPHAEGGYKKSNTKYPVAFVRDNGWADFLHEFLKHAPNP